ncbi:MAG: dienelactone hydrolase family protein [Omnitrophica WOR_2 bacterium]
MIEPVHNRYLAIPPSGKGAGVLVLHAWWGLNDFFRDFCDRLAQEGFVALAPDLFEGTVARTIEEAERHQSQWNEEQAVPPVILPAVEELSKHAAVTGHGLGVVGFSMGAYWALWLAQKYPELIRAVALFYGTDGGGGDFQHSKAAYLGHFAEKDPYETESRIQELEKNLKGAGRPTTFYTYPGTGHWFFEKDRQDAYHAPSAQLAWERTITFLHDRLEGAPG